MRANVAAALVVGFLAVSAWGQDAAGPADPQGSTELRWFDHFIVGGGWITWFLLIPLSVATVALALEYFRSIRREVLIPKGVQDDLAEHLRERRYVEALRLASRDRSMFAYVMHAALTEAAGGFGAMQRSVEEALEERAAKLMRKLEIINTIGNIAPMIGLFGTVYGMILLFAAIGAIGELPSSAIVAENLAIALVTTFWGLAIAIPALSVFAFFRNRVDDLTAECAIAADRLLAAFRPGVSPVHREEDTPAVPRPAPAPAVAAT